MIAFAEVRPQHLHDVWSFVRDGLLAIIEKTNDDWIPEDVYHEVKAGVSALFMIDNDDEQLGFVVLQVWPNYHAGPRLFVRAMWGSSGALVKHHDEINAQLRALALKCGARTVRQNSPRNWDAVGWTRKQSIFELEV